MMIQYVKNWHEEETVIMAKELNVPRGARRPRSRSRSASMGVISSSGAGIGLASSSSMGLGGIRGGKAKFVTYRDSDVDEKTVRFLRVSTLYSMEELRIYLRYVTQLYRMWYHICVRATQDKILSYCNLFFKCLAGPLFFI